MNDWRNITAMERFALLFGTWFGTGFLPVMPGTWGTMGAVPLVAVLSVYLFPWAYAVATVAIIIVSIPIASVVSRLNQTIPYIAALNPHKEPVFSNENFQKMIKGIGEQKKDPGMIVIDEVAGYAVAMLFVPFSWSALAISFVLFRIFDILKIQPGGMIEKLGGGTGIVLDDVAAGAYACIGTHAALWVMNWIGFPII